MEKIILIKYGELTTKKNNRKSFINLLRKNITNVLKNYDVKIKDNLVRMYIETNEEQIDEIVSKLTKIFGIHSIVIAYKTNTNIEDIKQTLSSI